MARRAVLSGGKRDQIIDDAMGLFFEHGYEATSVRMVMDRVGGEIGMFYHYFPSKATLFDQVVERFFANYAERFGALLEQCGSLEGAVDALLPLYEASMGQYRQLEGSMHWTIRYAMHARTVNLLVPMVRERLETKGVRGPQPLDILAGQLLYAVSATLHSPSFEAMGSSEQRACLLECLRRTLALGE